MAASFYKSSEEKSSGLFFVVGCWVDGCWMLGVDEVLIGGRCCIGLIRLIGLIGQISFITANESNKANVFY